MFPANAALYQFAYFLPDCREAFVGVEYVNGRFMRRPIGKRQVLNALAESPLRCRLEKLIRFGLVSVQDNRA
jgi:hypothetical protein